MKRVIALIISLFLIGCGGADYHRYMLTESMTGSNQDYHFNKLKEAGSINSLYGENSKVKACYYYPKEYGGFSAGCT